MVFTKTDETYATYELRYDADGTVWAQAQAHDTLVAKTVYKIVVNEFGQITAAQASDTNYTYLGVAAEAAAAADIVWLQVGGYVTGMITPSLTISQGHALAMNSGAIADSGADYAGTGGEFAAHAAATDAAAAAVHTVMLVPKIILGA